MKHLGDKPGAGALQESASTIRRRQHMDNRVRITIDNNGVADVALVRSD